ncbi:MAG: isoprenylcysteine carboxylmethyltransferase family protein [Paracoccaceae bacterium]|nr:isoprenylcysteine carboxylmethyltransferase family protein [Paracoccaceae bacterium]
MQKLWKNVLDMPPSWLLLFLALAWAQLCVAPSLRFGSGLLSDIGLVLMAVAVALMVWAALFFLRLRTSVVPRRVPSALIKAGPYRLTRNPIYLADAVFLLGFSLWIGSVLGILLVPVFMKLIEIRFIRGEEQGLRAAFPDEAEEFFRKTRRWL